MRAVSFSATPSFLLSARCGRFAGKAAELDLFYHDKQNGLASESVLFMVKQTIGCPNRFFDIQKTKKSPAQGGARDIHLYCIQRLLYEPR